MSSIQSFFKNQYLARLVLIKLEPSANPLGKLRAWSKLQRAALLFLLFHCSPMAGTENTDRRLQNCVWMFRTSEITGGSFQIIQKTQRELRPHFYQKGSNCYTNELVFQIRICQRNNRVTHESSAPGVRGKQDP